MNQRACGQVLRTEAGEAEGRKRRAWSIEELRQRLGLAAPKIEQPPARQAPTREAFEHRPRIVRRQMALGGLSAALG
jgi:hypothetical protein